MPCDPESELNAVIGQLLDGSLSREDASRWAAANIDEFEDDPSTDEILELIVMSDAWQFDEAGNRSGYMFDLEPIIRLHRDRMS